MALSRTAKFYRDNPEARKKRLAYQKEYNKKEENVEYRAKLNKFNRKNGKKGDGLDACHKKVKGKVRIVLCKMKRNRANKNGPKQQLK